MTLDDVKNKDDLIAFCTEYKDQLYYGREDVSEYIDSRKIVNKLGGWSILLTVPYGDDLSLQWITFDERDVRVGADVQSNYSSDDRVTVNISVEFLDDLCNLINSGKMTEPEATYDKDDGFLSISYNHSDTDMRNSICLKFHKS